MSIDNHLRFFRAIMHNLHIPVHRFEESDVPAYDLGLRAALGLNIREALPDLRGLMHSAIYFMADAFSWKYVFLRLPDSEEFLLAGPYVTENPSEQFLMALMERKRIPAEQLPLLKQFYRQVTLLVNESYLISITSALGEMIWGAPDAFSTEFASMAVSNTVIPDVKAVMDTRRDAAERQIIEARYEAESRLMYAVSHGQMHQAAMVLSSFNITHFDQRTSDPLRNTKNYLIICNTLLRKAAQQGSVHPLYIDQLSSALAVQIEQLLSVDAGVQMMGRMVHKYCLLVKNHNMTQYSQPVQSVILRVDTELAGDLSLSAHAASIGVNASYLSSLFKKETGQTLTEYVTRRRIDYAIYLLNTSDMQVQTIAQHCGIPDVNYFTRSFRKITGLTPTDYRAQIKGMKG